jgi:hypothetical protein
MDALRRRLPRFAALVLLVWLFATGVAFAHTCQAKIDLDCDGCCVEMKAPAVSSSARADVAAAPLAAAPLPQPPVLQLAWVPVEAAAVPAVDPPERGGTGAIPIVFLRLAL